MQAKRYYLGGRCWFWRAIFNASSGEALLGCAAVLSDLAARRRALRWASWLSNFRCLGRLVLLFREGQRDVCGKVPKYIVWGCDLASDKCIKITL